MPLPSLTSLARKLLSKWVMGLARSLQLSFVVFVLFGLLPMAALYSEDAKKDVPKITTDELTRGLSENMMRVKEFEIIRAEAKKLGVRVYLFGGTAAAYAHYVKKHLQQQKRGSTDQSARFDFDYFSVYRSTQDADLAVDGPRDAIEKLKVILQERLGHLQGSKPDWDIRSLREKTERQEALLNDFDFEQQNTDSHSIGAIEITEPEKGEALVRDLRNWSGRISVFLEDVRDGVLHFYPSDQHHETERAKRGENPDIFAVIRYLIKRFQFELDVVPEDMARVEEMIRKFDSEKDLANPKARGWVEKHGKKLIMHASNVEYAFKVLNELGLRKRLRDLSNLETGSLGWWMSKSALPGFEVGTGDGKMAKDQNPKIDIISHSTRDMFMYESIVRNLDGAPNILESRNSEGGRLVGEAAAFGSGHYTMIGTKGAGETGIDIRYQLLPEAREHTDYEFVPTGILVKNKNAIRVIPESVKVDPVTYFKILAENKIDTTDHALLELIRRRIHRDLKFISEAEKQEIEGIVEKAPSHASALFSELAGLGLLPSLKISEAALVKMLFSALDSDELADVFEEISMRFLAGPEREAALQRISAQIARVLEAGGEEVSENLIFLVREKGFLSSLKLDEETLVKLIFYRRLSYDVQEKVFQELSERFLTGRGREAVLQKISARIARGLDAGSEEVSDGLNFLLCRKGLLASLKLDEETLVKMLFYSVFDGVRENVFQEFSDRFLAGAQRPVAIRRLVAQINQVLKSDGWRRQAGADFLLGKKEVLSSLKLGDVTLLGFLLSRSLNAKVRETVFQEFSDRFLVGAQRVAVFQRLSSQIAEVLKTRDGGAQNDLNFLLKKMIEGGLLPSLNLDPATCFRILGNRYLEKDLREKVFEEYRLRKQPLTPVDRLDILKFLQVSINSAANYHVNIETIELVVSLVRAAIRIKLISLPDNPISEITDGRAANNADEGTPSREKRIQKLIEGIPNLKALVEIGRRLGVHFSLFGTRALELLLLANGDAKDEGLQASDLATGRLDLDVLTDATGDALGKIQSAIESLGLSKKVQVRNSNDLSNIHLQDLSEANAVELPLSDKLLLPGHISAKADIERILRSKELRFLPAASAGGATSSSGRASRIRAAVRYLVHLALLELKPDETSLDEVRRIVAAEDIASMDNFTREYLRRNIMETLRSIRRPNDLIKILHQVGLKDRLLSLPGYEEHFDEVRKYLQTIDVGAGDGMTAMDLGIHRVAHEIQTLHEFIYLYRNQWHSMELLAEEHEQHKVHFARLVGEDERSSLGEKIFYVIDPNAREGSDFLYFPESKTIALLNRAAVKRIEAFKVSSLPRHWFVRALKRGASTGIRGRRNQGVFFEMLLLAIQKQIDVSIAAHDKHEPASPPCTANLNALKARVRAGRSP